MKIALAAPPLDGRANQELVEYLAKVFRVPQFAVDVIAGAQSRTKTVRIAGLTMEQVRARLEDATAAAL